MGNTELLLPEAPEPLGNPQGFDLSIGDTVLDGRLTVISRLGLLPSKRLSETTQPFDSIEELRARDTGDKVYLTTDWDEGDNKAVKVLHDSSPSKIVMNDSELAVNQLLRNHPNIAPWVHMGVDDVAGVDRRIMVSPVAEAGSLKNIMMRDGNLDPEAAMFMGASVAKGLGLAHDRRIVHRDIKPENVLYFPEEEAWKLMDWGLAERMQDDAPQEINDLLGATALWQRIRFQGDRNGNILGTLGYMAPERLVGDGEYRPPAEADDIFALSATILSATTGYNPYSYSLGWEINQYAEHVQHVNEGPAIEAMKERGLGLEARQVIIAGFDDPENRPDAQEFVSTLEAA